MPTIGLCMIVKNEAQVIVRCLESVRPLVDFVLIEDTGSTDGTQDIIRKWLTDVGIPGLVMEEPWRDFSYNRTHALRQLRELSDVEYCFMMDADDQLRIDRQLDIASFKETMTADFYDVEVLHGSTRHYRPHIYRNSLAFSYRGVLHEFVEVPEGAKKRETAVGFCIAIIGGGARNSDGAKFERDARVLEQALGTETDGFLKSRYTFYLAQSYRDMGEKEKALKHYLARAEMGFWKEEGFASLLNAARMMEQLGYHEDEVVKGYLRAAEFLPTRAEALHGASRFARGKNNFKDGYRFAEQGARIAKPAGGLFIEDWIYEYGLLDELAVNAYWTGQYQVCLDVCQRLLVEGKLPKEMRVRIERNASAARARLSHTVSVPLPTSTAISMARASAEVADTVVERPPAVSSEALDTGVPGPGERSPDSSEMSDGRLRQFEFPPAFVVNLDRRPDRWEASRRTCKAAGIDPIRISAIEASPGWVGCGYSQLKCLQIAKDRNLPWVLVLEDDACFEPEAIERFKVLLPFLWNNRESWERFNGGPTFPSDYSISVLNRQMKLMYARGLAGHFNLYHQGAYDLLLQWRPSTDKQFDVYLMSLEARFRTVFNSVATVPHISTQKADMSDVTPGLAGSVQDYSAMFRYSEARLQECLDAALGEPRRFEELHRASPVAATRASGPTRP